MGSKPKENSALQVEWRALDSIRPYPKNARKISQKAIDSVAKSITEFGWRQPIVVDVHGVIVIGHVRRLAAIQLTLLQVPVHVCDLPDAKIRALRLMDNRSHDEAQWDMEVLTAEMLELRGLDLDLGLTGFASRELDAMMRVDRSDEDDVPEVSEAVVTKPGDLWLMGNHRLLCGDATSAEDVARLMNREQAGLIATDPPYGISYDNQELHGEHGVSYAKIAGDDHHDEALQAFLEKAFACALDAIRIDAAWYLWHAMLTQGFFAAAAAAAAHVCLHRQIIWVKPVLVFGRGQYHWKHELCFMGWIKGHQPPDYGDHKETTVWDVSGVAVDERREFEHATPKPVELFRRPILKHLQHSEIAYEPFAGTGPQFIAAESTGRRCFGLELEPKYCDVIVRRWQKFTGREATLEGSGATFEHVKDGRFLEWQDEIKEEVLGR